MEDESVEDESVALGCIVLPDVPVSWASAGVMRSPSAAALLKMIRAILLSPLR